MIFVEFIAITVETIISQFVKKKQKKHQIHDDCLLPDFTHKDVGPQYIPCFSLGDVLYIQSIFDVTRPMTDIIIQLHMWITKAPPHAYEFSLKGLWAVMVVLLESYLL